MKPKRIQRKRTKGWKMPENTVYVGRGTKWGNPFKVPTFSPTKKQVVELFEAYINCWALPYFEGKPIVAHLDPTESFLFCQEIKQELKGKNLACWCKLDEPCHADILLKIANGN